jgi:hypothetical protein
MVEVGNLKTQGGEECTERGTCFLCVEESETHLLLKIPETQKWRKELLNKKWPHIDEAMALRKILSTRLLNREN